MTYSGVVDNINTSECTLTLVQLESDSISGLTLVGSLISAANLPHGLCRTPLYLTAPLALTALPDLALAPLVGLLTPGEEAECILCR